MSPERTIIMLSTMAAFAGLLSDGEAQPQWDTDQNHIIY